MNDVFSSNAIKSQLGNYYQYIVVLELCLDGNEGEVIFVEKKGDVANSDVTIEAKYHERKDYLTSRSVDLWKTIKNYTENIDKIKDYKKIILLTTSEINAESDLAKWNELNPTDKLNVLRNAIIDNIPASISKYVEFVFTYIKDSNSNELAMLDMLEKFYIQYAESGIKAKLKELESRKQFVGIPPKNRPFFIQALLGHLMTDVYNAPEKCEIEISDFNYKLQSENRNYSNENIPIPDFYREYEGNISDYKDYIFVKEIEKIKLPNKTIKSAVDDYYRTFKTIIHLTDNDPYSAGNLDYYQNNVLLHDITNIKELCCIDVDSEGQALKAAKKCYLKSMSLPLKLVKGYNPNQDFFQRGNIHIIVNDSKFSWAIDYEG